MSSSSPVPVAAQTDPSATRPFEPATVEPGGTVTVEIDIEGVGLAGSVTERLPAAFTYVGTTALSPNSNTLDGSTRVLVFPFVARGGSASPVDRSTGAHCAFRGCFYKKSYRTGAVFYVCLISDRYSSGIV